MDGALYVGYLAGLGSEVPDREWQGGGRHELMTSVLALLRLVDDEAIAAASMGRLRHETQPGDTGSPCHSARGLSLRLEVVHELNRCALARPA